MAGIAHRLDDVLSRLIFTFAILLFLFGTYVIWDNIRIENNANGDDFIQYKPSVDDVDSYTLKELQRINPDVCAWITVKDTHIDYPVVLGRDNMEYINKDIKGEFSYSGSIFLDSRNKKDLSDSYLVMYGHHMNKNGMFSDVSNFLDQKYLESHQVGYLFGDGFVRKIHFFACCSINAADVVVYNVDDVNQSGTATLLKYVQAKAKTYLNDGDYTQGDVIALSTCAEATTNGRFVLFGIMGPKEFAQPEQHKIS